MKGLQPKIHDNTVIGNVIDKNYNIEGIERQNPK